MHDAMQIYLVALRATRRSGRCGSSSRRCTSRAPALGGIMFDDIGPEPPAGHRDLQRRLHLRAARRRPEPGRVGPAHDLLDRLPRDGPRVQSRALLAEVARRAVGVDLVLLADEPEAAVVHELPVSTSPAGRAGSSPISNTGSATASCSSCGMRRERFVQMGNAAWFDHHGFQGASGLPEPGAASGAAGEPRPHASSSSWSRSRSSSS